MAEQVSKKQRSDYGYIVSFNFFYLSNLIRIFAIWFLFIYENKSFRVSNQKNWKQVILSK